MKIGPLLYVPAFIAVLTMDAAAEVYTCKDANGNSVFQDSPCESQQAVAKAEPSEQSSTLTHQGGAKGTVLFVLDGSGSMWGQVEGKRKIDIARSVMGDMVQKLPGTVKTGLMSYGHNRKDDCGDIEMVTQPGGDRNTLVVALNNIKPKGKTPLTAAIRHAAVGLRQTEGSASVVVISDGKETCEGDPCSAARVAREAGVNLRIHVVGFDVTTEERDQLVCIAKEGGGKYFQAANAEELVVALAEVKKEVVTPAPEPPKPVQVAAKQSTVGGVLFEDHFDRNELGDAYELLDPDADRFIVDGGKFLSVATKPPANLVLLNQSIEGDFAATIAVTMQVTTENWASLYYWIDKDTRVSVGVWSAQFPERRAFRFSKVVGGKRNVIYYGGDRANAKSLGQRNLVRTLQEPEIWYLQIQKKGFKLIGRASDDGRRWIKLGPHTLLKKGGRLGFRAGSGGGTENAAEFDDFVVRRLQ